MPGSLTTPGRSSTRITRPPVLPSAMTTASAPGTSFPFAARWLAYALPYRRFAAALTDDDARLGANVDRYSFTERDLHPLLLAGFAGALRLTFMKKGHWSCAVSEGRLSQKRLTA
jgi:hypothetical protein